MDMYLNFNHCQPKDSRWNKNNSVHIKSCSYWIKSLYAFLEWVTPFPSIDLWMQTCWRTFKMHVQKSKGRLLPFYSLLKTGSDKIICWLGRYSFLLWFIMSKKPWEVAYWTFDLNIKSQTFWGFWNNKTQKERAFTKAMNYLIWTRL